MANIHILTKREAEVAVVIHVAIPNANNTAGVNWRTALLNSGVGGTTVLKSGDGTAGTIAAAELTAIQAGALYEAAATVRVGTVALANINAYLDTQYAALSNQVLAVLQDQLGYYGYSR